MKSRLMKRIGRAKWSSIAASKKLIVVHASILGRSLRKGLQGGHLVDGKCGVQPWLSRGVWVEHSGAILLECCDFASAFRCLTRFESLKLLNQPVERYQHLARYFTFNSKSSSIHRSRRLESLACDHVLSDGLLFYWPLEHVSWSVMTNKFYFELLLLMHRYGEVRSHKFSVFHPKIICTWQHLTAFLQAAF